MVPGFSEREIAAAEERRQDLLREAAAHEIISAPAVDLAERDDSERAEAAHQQMLKSVGYPGPGFVRWVSDRLARLNGQSRERWPTGTT